MENEKEALIILNENQELNMKEQIQAKLKAHMEQKKTSFKARIGSRSRYSKQREDS